MADIDQVKQREAGLPKVLGVHQLSMVAVGAIISFGLLSGAAYPLNLAGLGVIPSYLAASAVVLLMAYCLSEMAARHPTPGAFGAYAESYLGVGSGFVVRSAYVLGLLFIVGTEVELLGGAMASIVPGAPKALVVYLALAAIIGVNLLPVRWFARLEYVLSTIKVVALLAFIAMAWHFFWQSEAVITLPNDLQHAQAWLSWEGTWAAFILAVLGYAGMESLAVAAGETEANGNAIRRTIRLTAWLIASLAVAVVVAATALAMLGVLPITLSPSSFLLQHYGLSPRWFQAAVVVAVLSVINSQLYSASRMLFSLGRAEPRLQWLGRVHGESPRMAVLTAGAASFLVYGAFQRYTYETFLVATTVASSCLLLVWLMVFFSYLRFWRQAAHSVSTHRRLRAWPAWIGVVLVLGVAVSTWELELFALTLQVGLPLFVVLWLMHRLCLRAR